MARAGKAKLSDENSATDVAAGPPWRSAKNVPLLFENRRRAGVAPTRGRGGGPDARPRDSWAELCRDDIEGFP